MEKAKVYFSDLRTSPTSNLLDKMERLLKRAGIGQLPLKDSFTAIKIHFGEPGNLAYIIRKSKFPQNPKRSVRFSGKRTKRSVQKRKARNTQKAETKVL